MRSEQQRLAELQQQQLYQHDLKVGNAVKRTDNSKANSDRSKSALVAICLVKL